MSLFLFGDTVEDAARAHAIQQFPNEACGIVEDGKFIVIENISDDPTKSFEMPDSTWTDYKIQAVIHSHGVSEVFAPSGNDMLHQIQTGVPWGIIQTDGVGASPILWWGDHLLEDDLIGREFVHGSTDCYGAIRAWFWQNKQIKLPDVPRDMEWWNKDEDLYTQGFKDAGFREIQEEEATVGDVALINFRSKVPNHGGVLVEDGLLYHHLQNRLACREPVGRWKMMITKWLRYEG